MFSQKVKFRKTPLKSLQKHKSFFDFSLFCKKVNFFDPKRTFRRLSHFLKSWKTLIWGPESLISPNPPNLSFGFDPPPKSLIECDREALHQVEKHYSHGNLHELAIYVRQNCWMRQIYAIRTRHNGFWCSGRLTLEKTHVSFLKLSVDENRLIMKGPPFAFSNCVRHT